MKGGTMKQSKKKMVAGIKILLTVFFALLVEIAWADTTGGNSASSVTGWAFLAASLATGLSTIGAGIAVAYVGSAAVGAMAEKPEVAGKALIYVGLAEGIAIYGLIIAIMILGKV